MLVELGAEPVLFVELDIGRIEPVSFARAVEVVLGDVEHQPVTAVFEAHRVGMCALEAGPLVERVLFVERDIGRIGPVSFARAVELVLEGVEHQTATAVHVEVLHLVETPCADPVPAVRPVVVVVLAASQLVGLVPAVELGSELENIEHPAVAAVDEKLPVVEVVDEKLPVVAVVRAELRAVAVVDEKLPAVEVVDEKLRVVEAVSVIEEHWAVVVVGKHSAVAVVDEKLPAVEDVLVERWAVVGRHSAVEVVSVIEEHWAVAEAHLVVVAERGERLVVESVSVVAPDVEAAGYEFSVLPHVALSGPIQAEIH